MTFSNINPPFLNEDLKQLELLFRASGYSLVFVGGCVRDTLCGKNPKDIDLATSATPEEQIALYRTNGLRYIETGLQHGTVTVVINGEQYEITTYRIDQETDGRHASVSYTRDLVEDLARRDLTINAIAMYFDGRLVDPFGGIDDLKNGRVRFVGDARERIEEDYLRILRFFRFQGRFGQSLDQDACEAIKQTVEGLRRISVERVWMEMSKIISGRNAEAVTNQMAELGVLDVIGMPIYDVASFTEASDRAVINPSSVMGWYMRSNYAAIDKLATAWKWATEERQRAQFVAKNVDPTLASFKLMLVDGVRFEWVEDLMRLNQINPDELKNWVVPKMPVSGQDLIMKGFKPGPEMGRLLGDMKKTWVQSDYTLDKTDLMSYLQSE